MYVVELARIPARVTCAAQHGTVVSAECPDDIIFAIIDEQIVLVPISRKCEIVGGAIAQRFLPQKEFL